MSLAYSLQLEYAFRFRCLHSKFAARSRERTPAASTSPQDVGGTPMPQS